jgi:predicted lipid-binding transport protein (Tim44 family)
MLVALLFLFFIGMESIAFARAGGGRSSGSRGFSSGRSAPSQQQATPQTPPVQQPAPAPSMGRSLLYGLGGGLLGGMIGSMLFGGRGYAGGQGWGEGGFGFGDAIIILIVLGIIYFVVKRFRARRAMEMGSAGGAYSPSYTYDAPAAEPVYNSSAQGDPVSGGLRHISEMDSSFDESKFKELVEDNFFRIQSAWTKRDLSGVRNLFTPQMLNTFQEEVNKAIASKQINRLENIAVRQVEVVNAAQDQGEEYITVKFLASLLDYTVDETDNQVISGSSTEPVKFLEYWTFTRKIGERSWLLGGITQEGDY